MNRIKLFVLGPFGWPLRENGLPPIPNLAGVYLMTSPCDDGYLPYGVGITRRPVKKRFAEHTRQYMKGEYNVLNTESARRGIRELVWKGWGWTPEKRAAFESRKEYFEGAAREQMSATSIFVVDTGTAPRIMERVEAAIANHYYKNEDTLFDRGMLRMPRWPSEQPLEAEFQCTEKLIGLSRELAI